LLAEERAGKRGLHRRRPSGVHGQQNPGGNARLSWNSAVAAGDFAVLPFQNMTGDAEQEYFVDGMVEEITTAIARLPWLFVIARNSAFSYKGKPVDVKQVAQELGVRYVLEGSVRKAGNRVRITGQLIDTTTGAHIWPTASTARSTTFSSCKTAARLWSPSRLASSARSRGADGAEPCCPSPRSDKASSATSTGAGCHTWCKRMDFARVVAGDK
jgi:TolB-like protein